MKVIKFVIILSSFVNVMSAQIVTTANDTTIVDGLILELPDEVRGDVYVQWERSIDTLEWTKIKGAVTPSYSPSTYDNYYFRAEIISANCDTLYSEITHIKPLRKITKGKIELPIDINISYDELKVIGTKGNAKVDSDYRFEVPTLNGSEREIFLVTNLQDSVLMLAYYQGRGENEEVLITTRTTATAIVLLTPFLETKTIQDFKASLDLIESDENYPMILEQVKNVLQLKGNLFSGANSELATYLSELVNNLADTDIFRNGSNVSYVPFDFEKGNGIVKIKGSTNSISYVGGVVKGDNEELLDTFLLPGSMFRESGLTSAYNIITDLTGENKILESRSRYEYALGEADGEFRFVLRSGASANDPNDPFSDLALIAREHNFGWGLITTFLKAMPFGKEFIKNLAKSTCTKQILQTLWDYGTAQFEEEFGEKKAPEFYSQVLNRFFTTKTLECASEFLPTPEHTKILSGIWSLVKKVNTGVRAIKVTAHVASSLNDFYQDSSMVEYCFYNDPFEGKIYNCFVLEPVNWNDSLVLYKCDDLPGSVYPDKPIIKAIEDTRYDNVDDPNSIANLSVFWEVEGGNGQFKLEDGSFTNIGQWVQTNGLGESIIDWRLGPSANRQSIKAFKGDQEVRFEVQSKHFSTLDVEIIGNDQIGMYGEYLEKPIQLKLIETEYTTLNIPILEMINPTRFDIQWEITRGTEGQLDTFEDNFLFSNLLSRKLKMGRGNNTISVSIKDQCGNSLPLRTGNPIKIGINEKRFDYEGTWEYNYLTYEGDNCISTRGKTFIHEGSESSSCYDEIEGAECTGRLKEITLNYRSTYSSDEGVGILTCIWRDALFGTKVEIDFQVDSLNQKRFKSLPWDAQRNANIELVRQ